MKSLSLFALYLACCQLAAVAVWCGAHNVNPLELVQ